MLLTSLIAIFEFKMTFSCRNNGGGKCFSSTQGVGKNSIQKKYSWPLHPLSIERGERREKVEIGR
jgi:hypothetical protein